MSTYAKDARSQIEAAQVLSSIPTRFTSTIGDTYGVLMRQDGTLVPTGFQAISREIPTWAQGHLTVGANFKQTAFAVHSN